LMKPITSDKSTMMEKVINSLLLIIFFNIPYLLLFH
jgi:hypothetical protein